MSTQEDHVFVKLREVVDSWASEVTQTRSSLAHQLDAPPPSDQPVLRLIRSPQDAAVVAEERAALEQINRDLMLDKNKMLSEMLELEERISSSQRAVEEGEVESARLRSEISFAREQMHVLNTTVQESGAQRDAFELQVQETSEELGMAHSEISDLQKQLDGNENLIEEMQEQLEQNENSIREMQERHEELEIRAEATAKALAVAESEITDLSEQIRNKDWRLLKVDNELEALREDTSRQSAEIEAQEIARRQTLSLLEAERARTWSLNEELGAARTRVGELSQAIESLWSAYEGTTGQPRVNGDTVSSRLMSVQANTDFVDLDARDEAASDMVSELVIAQEALSSLRIEFDELSASRDRLRLALAEHEGGVEGAGVAESLILRDEHQLRETVMEDMAAELGESKHTLEELRVKYDQLLTAYAESQEPSGESGEENAYTQSGTVTQAREELLERDAALYALQNEFETVQSSLARLRGEHNELMSTHTALRESSNESRSALEAAETRAHAAESLAAELAEEGSLVSSQLEVLAWQPSGSPQGAEIAEEGRFTAEERAQQEELRDRELDKLTAQFAEKIQALEDAEKELRLLEEQLVGHERIEQTLREELTVALSGDERNDLEQEALMRALRGEVEALRQVAIDKDFVIFHTEAEMNDAKQRETELNSALRGAVEVSEKLKAEFSEGGEAHRGLRHELTQLQEGALEKDSALRNLRREVLTLRSRLHSFLAEQEPERAGGGVSSAQHSPAPADKSEGVARIMRLWGGKDSRAK